MSSKRIIHFLLLCLFITILHVTVCYPSLLIDTPIATPQGMVLVQNLKVGDKVLTYDFNKPNPQEVLTEVTVTKINKHITDAIFTINTSEGSHRYDFENDIFFEASPHQLFFVLKQQPDNSVIMDFVQAKDITTNCMLIDDHMNCVPIVKVSQQELTSTYPQYIVKVTRDHKNRFVSEKRVQVVADVYAVEVTAPHTFLIAERHNKKNYAPRLFLVHNGIPALGLGVSLAFDSSLASLSLAQISASIGALNVTFGPVGAALGIFAGAGYVGYKLFGKKGKTKQSSLYIERVSPPVSSTNHQQSQSTGKKYSLDNLIKNNLSLKNISAMNESTNPICTFPTHSSEPFTNTTPMIPLEVAKCELPITTSGPQICTTPIIDSEKLHGCVNPIISQKSQIYMTLIDLDTLGPNKIKHIIEGSRGSDHKWERLVPDKDWNKIKEIIKEVMETGNDGPYKGIKMKTKKIKGENVEVPYFEEDDIKKISNAWVK